MTAPTTITPSGASRRSSAWERWIIVWHIVFYISLLIPMALVLTTGTMRYSTVAVLALSILLGAWYALIMIWLIPRAPQKFRVAGSVVYLAVAFVLWFPLARAHWAYFITASSFYGLMWGTLPFWMAVTGNLILTAIIIWIQSLNLNRPIEFSIESVLIALVTIGWATLLALWMRTVMRESAQRKRLIEQLETTQANLAESERQAGILQERQRMAGEIHDTLAQSFTSIIMQLEAAEQALPPENPQAVCNHIRQARQTARQGLVDARRLVQALRPASLEDASLSEALQRTVQRWSHETGIMAQFTISDDPYPLHPDAEVILLRSLQEALTNVHKHAQAHNVSVTLSYMQDQVSLDVQDDGIGINPDCISVSDRQEGSGVGLSVMRQRVAKLGGQVIVESAPGSGTTLVVQFPVRERQPKETIP